MKPDIYDILFWIFFIIAVTLVSWYIFGGSSTIEQALLVLIITFLFKIQSDMLNNKAKIDILERRFNSLALDFKEKTKIVKGKNG
ncbi:MAG TPA: hypothetical protein VJH92_05435 [Candidatus Nanoarchaeia archaeon]|nr:hypothetical protein [Candidatus Nanoarchaeia archaeon]